MTPAERHPPLDTIADYVAELLPVAEADAVAEHLSGCPRCAADGAAVRQVPAILSGAGHTPLPMPESVKRAVDDALRSESEARASSLVRLADRRTPPAPAHRSRSRVPLLAAAAAVIAVAGIAGVVRSIDLSPEANSASSSVKQPRSTVGGAQAAQPSAASTGAFSTSPRSLSPQNLSSYAAGLSRTQPGLDHSSTDNLRAAGCTAPHTQPTDLVTVANWRGGPAVVVVSPTTRRVSVLDCASAVTVLYSTSY